MNFIWNIKKEDFDYGSTKNVIFFFSFFLFFLRHQLGPNVFIIENQNNLQIKYQDSKFQSTLPSSFDFIFGFKKLGLYKWWMKEMDLFVKVYWLIDPPLVIRNEMFFKKEGNPNTLSATNHMSHDQTNNPRSLVIWFELIQKVTHKGLNMWLQTIFFYRH
jgi:hypothetical protein